MSSERDQAKPLASSAVRPSTEDEDALKFPSPTTLHRRRCIICCGCCTAAAAIVAVVFIVIALTVYKVREPQMRMNSIKIQGLTFNPGSTPTSSPSVNMTVLADISVKNPNAASFSFGGSVTSLYYRSELVGVAYGPPGTAPARRTMRTNVTVDVMADQLLKDPNLVRDLRSGVVVMSSSTIVGGRVRVLGMVKHHVDVMMNCTVTVSVTTQAILDQNCVQRVWL